MAYRRAVGNRYTRARRMDAERHVFHGSSLGARVNNKWRKIQSSFWFIPSVMSLASFCLAVLLLYLDQHTVPDVVWLQSWIYGGSAGGANDVLTLIASSMIGIAGVTFSITIVALTLASGHFGPRLLRNFMKDLGNQVVLGTYISTFVYCLWVIQAVQGQGELTFVPRLSVSTALLLALAGLGVLIFFFHHVSVVIQAGHVIADAHSDLVNAVERHLLDKEDSAAAKEEEEDDRQLYDQELEAAQTAASRMTAAADKTGYVQAIDYAYLLAWTKRHDAVIELHLRPGDFMIAHSSAFTVYAAEAIDEETLGPLQQAFFVGSQKTSEQDLEYSLDQLVEIAVRALSPGVNDPATAASCIDYLAAALAQASQKHFPSGLYRDEDGQARVFAKRFTFAGMFNAAFHQLRQNAGSAVTLYLRLLEVFTHLAPLMRTEEQKEVLRLHSAMVHKACRENISEPRDLQAAETRYAVIENHFREPRA